MRLSAFIVASLVLCRRLTAMRADACRRRRSCARSVDAELRRIADGVDGVVGYAIVDLTSGERFERQADQPFPTASTIKLAVLYELLQQVDEHRLTLDEPKPIAERHARRRERRAGRSCRVRCSRCGIAPS